MKNIMLAMQTTTHPSKKTSNSKIIIIRNLPRMARLPMMGMMIIMTNTPKIQGCMKKPPKL